MFLKKLLGLFFVFNVFLLSSEEVQNNNENNEPNTYDELNDFNNEKDNDDTKYYKIGIGAYMDYIGGFRTLFNRDLVDKKGMADTPRVEAKNPFVNMFNFGAIGYITIGNAFDLYAHIKTDFRYTPEEKYSTYSKTIVSKEGILVGLEGAFGIAVDIGITKGIEFFIPINFVIGLSYNHYVSDLSGFFPGVSQQLLYGLFIGGEMSFHLNYFLTDKVYLDMAAEVGVKDNYYNSMLCVFSGVILGLGYAF